MIKKHLALLLAGVFIISLSGCATCKKKDSEIQSLKSQIQALESQMQVKDNEISNLREALAREMQEKKRTSTAASETKERPTAKQIQIALKNAGYNPGPIDGKIGKQTKDAIRAFQKSNGLAVDGKVGKLTWGLLKEYLDKKVK